MELMPNLKRAAYKLTFVVVIFSILLWFSIFLYGITYYLYIPAVAHTRPVYLQYPAACRSEEVVNPQNTHCPFPSANISLVKQGQYQLLSRGQGYAVEVILEMPESEKNRLQGMFMVKLDMLSPKGEVIQSSSRPAVLHYKSWLFSIIYTVFFAPGLLAGSVEEKQVLVIPLFEEFEEHPYHPTHYAYIEVQARYAEIYSSSLRIHAQFTGMRYMMYYWPVTSAILGVFWNFFFISMMILFSWLRYTMNNHNDDDDNDEPVHHAAAIQQPITTGSSSDNKTDEPSSSHMEMDNDTVNIPSAPEFMEATPSAPSIEDNGEAGDTVLDDEPLLRRRVVTVARGSSDTDDSRQKFIQIPEYDQTSPSWTSSESDPPGNLSSFALPDSSSSSSSSAYSEPCKEWEQNFTSTSSSV